MSTKKMTMRVIRNEVPSTKTSLSAFPATRLKHKC